MHCRLRRLVLLCLVTLLVLTGCAYKFRGTPYEPPVPAGEIEGVNWDGSAFRLSGLNGKPALVFFGYTNCPDVCPTTLAEMRVLYEQLGDKAKDLAVVFVSVDPERDSVEQLAKYIPAFNEKFYGVRVDPITLEQVKQEWGVIAEKKPYQGSESASKYSVDHTARQYLVGPRGNLAASYAFGTPVEDLKADVEFVLKGMQQ